MEKDMTKGSPLPVILQFTLPLIIGNIFQQLYNTVDTWVVGNYVSNEAFSAVGTVGPVINMLIGGIVKVVVNYILVAIPSLNIIGAAIGTIVCYVTITALDLIAMRRTVTTHPAVARNLIRPAAAAAIMGAATFFAEAVLRRVTNSNTIICLGALVIAVIVYAIFVLTLQCITYEDCLLLPKGEKIAKTLHIKHKT